MDWLWTIAIFMMVDGEVVKTSEHGQFQFKSHCELAIGDLEENNPKPFFICQEKGGEI